MAEKITELVHKSPLINGLDSKLNSTVVINTPGATTTDATKNNIAPAKNAKMRKPTRIPLPV